jgi:hypothetical protein
MPHPVSNPQPESPTKAFVEEYSRFEQFHGIPDQTLMRLAERKTGLRVPNRWVAIALIIRNPVPIPVPRPAGARVVRPKTATAPAKLEIVTGGKRTEEKKQKALETSWLAW